MDPIGNWHIRRATPDDAEEAADLLIAARRAAVPAIPPSVHPDDGVHRWMREKVVPTQEVWLATAMGDGGLLGLLVLDGDWLNQLYLRPGVTGRGLGSALLDVAKSARPGGLQLWAFQSNVGALRFYERHGFVEEARTDGDNEEGAPDVRYRWTP